ncbi:hypothetical protein [Metallosphaera hakonensis]|uniref:Uncharacterized protein n=1 Tax=Metallosphaera hakonensis JCM 8857 = DSM 7519 TaxID=1293036 RepID=A0A2U9IRU6_9CREN|nr:hypothetical protein [Metallosphaera hakonensis]AWR98760.1 hypothetical protein DFR87_02605 [Metallosphaera hakonensis JCM 8857 = DSM 7519]
MKKLARELSSLYQGGKVLLVVPGYDVSFLNYLEQELDSAFIVRDRQLTEGKTGIVRFPIAPQLWKHGNLIIVSNFATPKLLRKVDLAVIKKSEDLMREGYLSPFRILSYKVNSPQYKFSRSRLDFILSLGEASVVPANKEEAKFLRSKGIAVINNIFEAERTSTLVISRRMNLLNYLQLRSTILHGGRIIDLSNNREMEDWSIVSLGELGYYPFVSEEIPDGNIVDNKSIIPEIIEDRVIKPREKAQVVRMKKGQLSFNGVKIGEYRVRGGYLSLSLGCGRETFGAIPVISKFISPMSTGRCSVYFSCIKELGDPTSCREMAMEAYVLTLNYINSIANTNFTKVASLALRGISMKSIENGVALKLKVADEVIGVSLKRVEDKFLVMCDSCEKFKDTSIRIRSIQENYQRLVKVLRDLLLKEMITFKHSPSSQSRLEKP